MKRQRRDFLLDAAGMGAVVLSSQNIAWSSEQKEHAAKEKKEAEKEAEISAPEDLMREHGVLNRILLIYEEAVRRMKSKEDLPPDALRQPAQLVRKFVEDYHEQLEQKFVFPEFEKRQKLVDLVSVLRRQHEAGRGLTDTLLRATAPDQFVKAEARQEIIRVCEAFVRMYRPHEAREDTVLFPRFHEIVPAAKVKELGEQFEDEEHRLFGEQGFQETVEQVAAIEKQLGIYDLAAFTPK